MCVIKLRNCRENRLCYICKPTTLPPTIPPSPTTAVPPTDSLPPISSFSVTNPLLPTPQPATHPSGHPKHSVQQLQTTLHRCCDVEITNAEIEDGSTVIYCPRPGCETVWVSQLQYFQL